jgi:2-dehydro-3-deoxyphosphogluconate aldolase/(4S)-4-hydroxy-2-oxoglutarate aldolase
MAPVTGLVVLRSLFHNCSRKTEMFKESQIARIERSGIVAVIRSSSSERLVEVAKALLAGGVDVMEVTFTIPNPLRVIEQVADAIGDHILLGAGTVLDAETARSAMLAGAEFIVSPSFHRDVIEICRRYDKAVMPGAFTPTEVIHAWQAGADIVKIFPADVGGPNLLKALRGPLPQVRMMPTGGVNLDTVEPFLRAGACALGVGGSLVDAAAIRDGNMQRIEELAGQFVAAVQRARTAT